MIHVSGVSKTYEDKSGKTLALKDISFDLPNKGFIGLSGENGCGKTTLLNLISTMDSEFTGEIHIDDLDVRTDYEFIRKSIISYVFQEDFFASNLTVLENVEFYCDNGNSFDSYDLIPKDKLGSYTDELSGGQKQKVSICRGLGKDYEILLVDEPTSSLDEKTTKSVFEILSKIARDKLVILVSHDMEMMNSYCNMIVCLNNGELEYVKKNNTVTDVIYTEEGVAFEGEVNLHAISVKTMNDILNEKGRFVIEKRERNSAEAFDYSQKKHDVNDTAHTSSLHKKLLGKSYLKGNMTNMMWSIVLFAFLLFIFGLFFDFTFFDSSDFVYKTINANQDSYVICKQGVVDSREDYFTVDKLNKAAEEYGTGIDYNVSINTEISFQFTGADGYSSYIYNLVYTDFDNYEFIFGCKPEDNSKIAITDYIADALIRFNPDYSDYEDILNKGIYLGTQNAAVSGIIRSDYQKYISENVSRKDSYDFSYYQQHFFAGIFYLNGLNGNEYASYYVSDYDMFVNLVFTEEIADVQYCRMNQKASEMFGYSDGDFMSVKIMNGFYANGIKEDESEDCVIYVPSAVKNLSFSFASASEYFMTNISSKEFFLYLYDYNTDFYCYSFTYAGDAVNIIKVIRYLFAVLMVVLIALLSLGVFLYEKKAATANKKLYFLSRMNGDSIREYVTVEIRSMLLTYAGAIVFDSALYFGGYALLNFMLSNSFRIDIVIFMSHFWNLMISFGALFLVLAAIYMIMFIIRQKKTMLRIIKE